MTASSPPIVDSRMRGPASILLVEDNPLDVRSTIRAARKLELEVALEVVSSGQAALDHLRHSAETRRRVGLVLLDLNLPGKDGHDVLSEIRSDPTVATTPVVILTSSTEPIDVENAYQRGANAYLTKPTGLDGWVHVIRGIGEFWLSLAILPGT